MWEMLCQDVKKYQEFRSQRRTRLWRRKRVGISVGWTGMRGRTHLLPLGWGKNLLVRKFFLLETSWAAFESSWRVQLLDVGIISISTTLRSPLAWQILHSSNIPNSCYFKGRARKGGTFTDRCRRQKSCRISRKRKGSFHDNHLQPAPPAPPVSAECENIGKKSGVWGAAPWVCLGSGHLPWERTRRAPREQNSLTREGLSSSWELGWCGEPGFVSGEAQQGTVWGCGGLVQRMWRNPWGNHWILQHAGWSSAHPHVHWPSTHPAPRSQPHPALKMPKILPWPMATPWPPQEGLMLNSCLLSRNRLPNLSLLMSITQRDFHHNNSQGLINRQQYLQGWSK